MAEGEGHPRRPWHDQAAESASSADGGWSEYALDAVEQEVVDHVRALVGNSLQTTDAGSILQQLLELLIDDESMDQILEDLGDVIVTSVSAAPPGFPLIDSGIIYEFDYGPRLDEVTVDFDADFEVGLPPTIAHTHVDHLGGRIVYDDGDWTSILLLSSVRLRCIAQVRSELDLAEITELSISVGTI